ncbi:DNA-processing protein DprA [Pseudoalteromonas fenneropenaei]|uniref:DNA-processing protein DprA n=1 Tax=Pseudoalteromonas fenneropenaei TaxID=1737459 RepID=A0ABV7CKN1_9GAMM
MVALTLEQYLQLSLCPALGVAKIQRWLAKLAFSDWHTASDEVWLQLGATTAQIQHFRYPPTVRIDKLIGEIEHKQLGWLGFFDADYPALLQQISAPPLILFYRGNAALLHTPQLAIVGSRSASATGRAIASEFAEQLTQHGLTITSGLAMGIDGAAHQGALRYGSTIAVLGTGVDEVYPKRHSGLYHQIVEQGLVISEFLPGTPPLATHFPRRNRIISGLSLGVLLVEAEIKSGSLITARYALEQNREVFAIPGSIRNPLASGCHHLIKQGAVLCENSEDILCELQLFSQNRLYVKEEGVNNVEDCPVLSNLGFEVTSFDALLHRTQWSVAELTAKLLDLELEDKVARVADGYIRVARG